MGSNPAGRAKFLLQHQRPEANTASGRFALVGTLVGTFASRMIEASDTLFACFSSVSTSASNANRTAGSLRAACSTANSLLCARATWDRLDQFPAVAEASKELQEKTRAKWKDVLYSGTEPEFVSGATLTFAAGR